MTFETAGSYDAAKVDAFREKIRDTFLGVRQPPVRADKVRGASEIINGPHR
jgi:hypothetical protein